ncbi:MAG: undecaprenyl-diphosphate phosphatase [Ruminococcaceae bacterium]|nr:undecaprenyl-diphosphate phosphatase [Oscillospiraceae bacterium]
MGFLQWLKIVVLGIVEGITEWLPISSTGHMILVDEFWKTSNSVLTEDFMKMFEVVIQLGAILAVVVLYFEKIWPFRNDRKAKTTFDRFCDREKFILWLKIALSCVPAILIGLPFEEEIDKYLFKTPVVAAMLIVYGIGFLFIERYNKSRKPRINDLSELRWSDAALIGIFQVLAMVPGTSRSGATILGGILIGASRGIAAEYTFFLAIPTMLGASALKLLKYGAAFTGVQIAALLVGMVIAFVVSVIAIKFLIGYIKKHDFSAFGWYRIALGLIVLLCFYVIL